MKRWILILLLLIVFIGGVGFGIGSARVLWGLAYSLGEINSRTTLVVDTQYFKEAMDSRKPFDLGEYTFVPSKSQPKTVKVAKKSAERIAQSAKR